MTAFLIAAAVLTALVLARLLWPLLRSARTRSTLTLQQLNTAVYREQLKELDRDLAGGQLSQAHYAEARDELQRRLLQDVREAPAAAVVQAPARSSLATMLVLALAMPLGAAGLYATLGNAQAIDYQAPADSPQQRADRALEELKAALKTPPSTPEDWLRIGRAFANVGRFNEAVRAFSQAQNTIDKDPDLLIELADLMSMAANDNLEGRPMQLVRQALVLNPKHPMGLMLMGTSAFRRGEPAAAIAEWEKLLAVLPPGSRDADLVQKNIEQARGEVAKRAVASAGGVPQGAASGPQVAKPVAPADPAALAAGSISGEVTLSPALAKLIEPGDTLFIIARADDGSKMPIAVLRRSATELPLKFTLDDSMAMVPQRTISKASGIVLLARVSKSGGAMAQPGDLISETGTPVKPGATGLRLVIDRRL